MLCAALCAHLVGAPRLGWLRGLAVCALVFLATFSAGSGCLLGLAVAAMLGIRALLARKITIPETVVAGVSFAVFAWALCTMPRGGGGSPPPLQAIKALLSGLAWPNVFFAPAAFLASLPLALLGFRYLQVPAFRTRNIEALLLMAGFVLLQCVGMGVFRGENGNFGMPSGRYNDIVIFVGLLNFTALLILLREWPTSRSMHLLRLLWVGLTVAGCGIHFLWRTWPFLARENGEWYEWDKQDAARQFVETGDPACIPELMGGNWDETLDITDKPERIRAILTGTAPERRITPGSLVGIPLKSATTQGFQEQGYPRPYYALPHFKYWGSYTGLRESGMGTFESAPFIPAADYLSFSIIVNKKARFTGYRLDGLSLTLVEQATGHETPLLPQLRSRFPSLFRDQEIVTAPVKKGARYVVQASDASPSEWFAFSQPWEGGRLTGITQALLDSGKLVLFCGLLLLVVALLPPPGKKQTL
jgi:hypothetical protein